MTPSPVPVPPEQFTNVLPGWVYFVGLLLAVWLGWRIERRLIPWAPCWACKGRGRWWAPWGVKAWRDCDVCGGSGRRRRGRLR